MDAWVVLDTFARRKTRYAVRSRQLSFLSMRYLPVLPRLLVMNLMVRVAIAYMYSIDSAKDTTNFSSFLLGAQLLCSFVCTLPCLQFKPELVSTPRMHLLDEA